MNTYRKSEVNSSRALGPPSGRMKFYVGFEVLTAVAMKSSVFWDRTLCSLMKINRPLRFKRHIPPKLRLTPDELPYIIFEKKELYVTF
jgi:hypothetical protein